MANLTRITVDAEPSIELARALYASAQRHMAEADALLSAAHVEQTAADTIAGTIAQQRRERDEIGRGHPLEDDYFEHVVGEIGVDLFV